jgi:TRAP transporter TAXI family solute receptor
VSLLLSGVALAGPSETMTAPVAELRLGTATPGGGFQLYGQNLAEVVNAGDPSLRIEALATRGSKENLGLLEAGEIDLGLVEGNAAREALEGIGRPAANLKVLFVMYPNPGMFVVRADSPYRNIDDLKGQRIAFGTRASGLRILANDVVDGLGLSPERDFEQVILEKAGDGPGMVLNGDVAALWGAGIGWPGFVEVAESQSGARFIAPSTAEIERIRARHPHLRPMSVPAGTYKGQDARIDSLGLWSVILVRTDLPDELAYRLARAIHRSGLALSERIPQGQYTMPCSTVDNVPAAQIHPGALRYFREEGYAL